MNILRTVIQKPSPTPKYSITHLSLFVGLMDGA
jgi:hypothetical protein